MSTIEGLLEYVESGGTTCNTLRDAHAEIGGESLRVVCLKLLGWMKSQHRMQNLKSLRLKKDHTWCENARLLLTDKRLFCDLFQISGDELDFLPTISDETKKEACAVVDESFSPKLMT